MITNKKKREIEVFYLQIKAIVDNVYDKFDDNERNKIGLEWRNYFGTLTDGKPEDKVVFTKAVISERAFNMLTKWNITNVKDLVRKSNTWLDKKPIDYDNAFNQVQCRYMDRYVREHCIGRTNNMRVLLELLYFKRINNLDSFIDFLKEDSFTIITTNIENMALSGINRRKNIDNYCDAYNIAQKEDKVSPLYNMGIVWNGNIMKIDIINPKDIRNAPFLWELPNFKESWKT